MLSRSDLTFLSLLVGLPLALIAGVVAWRSSRRPGRSGADHTLRVLAMSLLVLGGVAILLATLYPARGLSDHAGAGGVNLVPFDTVKRYAGSTWLPWSIVRDNLLGNILLFAPLGAGVALAVRRFGAFAGAVAALLVGFGASVAVEGLQYVLPLGRSVDVDDVMLNTIGAFLGGLGAAIALSWTGVTHPRRVARQQRRAARRGESWTAS